MLKRMRSQDNFSSLLLLLLSSFSLNFLTVEATFCCCHDLRGTRIISSCNYLRTNIACEAAGLTYYTGLLGIFQGCDLESRDTFDQALKDKQQKFHLGCTTLRYKCYLWEIEETEAEALLLSMNDVEWLLNLISIFFFYIYTLF